MRRAEKARNAESATSPRFLYVAIVFFLLLLGFVWLGVIPSLRYYYSAPVFSTDSSFFAEFYQSPGGLLDYVGRFSEQLQIYDWLGAFVAATLASLLFLATRSLLRRITGLSTRLAPFVPPLLAVLMLDCYDSPAYTVGFGALLAAGASLLYMKWKSTGIRLALSWVTGAVLLYAAGLLPFLLFLALAILFEIFAVGKWRLAWNILGVLGLVPLWLLFSSGAVSDLVTLPAARLPRIDAIVLYLFFLVAALILVLRSKILATKPSEQPRKREASRVARSPWWGRLVAATPGPLLCGFLFSAAWGLVWWNLDLQRRQLIQIDAGAERGQWNEVLASAAKLESLPPVSVINLVRSLYHTGRLLDDLFSFPVPSGFDLLPGFRGDRAAFRAESKTLLELGHVNMAEHFAHEALEREGNRPEILNLLHEVYVIKGRPSAARVFLKAMSKNPFQRKRAETALRCLARNSGLDANREEVQSRMIRTDQPGGNNVFETETYFLQLLKDNPQNQMAFEYLMSQYLLHLRLDQFVTQLGRLDQLGYKTLPRHFEEAILAYENLHSTKLDLHGRTVRSETRQRFQILLQVLKTTDLQQPQSRRALAPEFGNTFWYYAL